MNAKFGNAIIVDMDGTLAIKGDRDIFDYTKVNLDTLNEPIGLIVREMQKTHQIIIMSGREDYSAPMTLDWLRGHNIFPTELLMRKTKDFRKDTIIKEELYNTYVKDKYNVIFALDDRTQVVEMWRSKGLTCLQVAEGNF